MSKSVRLPVSLLPETGRTAWLDEQMSKALLGPEPEWYGAIEAWRKREPSPVAAVRLGLETAARLDAVRPLYPALSTTEVVGCMLLEVSDG